MVYNLLIIYPGGADWVISDVTDHGLISSGSSYYFTKNGRINYVPVHAVLYFGREFDWKNNKREETKC